MQPLNYNDSVVNHETLMGSRLSRGQADIQSTRSYSAMKFYNGRISPDKLSILGSPVLRLTPQKSIQELLEIEMA